MTDIAIRPAVFPDDLAVVSHLFREYARTLDFALDFQDFDAELAALPGKYATPAGCVLLAWQGETAVGCIALRAMDDGGCEMKRLYVRPGLRGQRLGYRLATRICEEARARAYARICLDTVPSMAAAVSLYTALGFVPTAPYVFNPVPGVMYFALALSAGP